ncbi:Fic family protein [uncultured Polaribacter sp.]|uniref:Fic family protein n=1 Tax=uncultured Polaribacter sp. TaxID=174711 RepID=UPI002615A4F9|nr:RNA-binding domain-containing protein [uncultured Polaribacter sp.]
MTETNRIEYKEILTKAVDIEKEVIAFLNYTSGGALIFGVDKFGKAVGVAAIDDTMLRIKDRLKTNIRPSCMGLFDISVVAQEGKQLVKVTIASGSEKPYFKTKYGMSERGCYMRVGTASEPMPQKTIDNLYASRTRDTISKIVSPKQKLSFEQLHIYYQEKGKALNAQFATNLELVTEDDTWNYAGYLLSDINNISIKVAKYAGTNRVELIETNEYGYTSLIKACKQVLDKLDVENRTIAKITAKDRLEKRLWNARALREAVINAFVHNDFSREVPPKFEIFSDRIEITSAGSLVDGLSEKEFFKGFSIPRNKELIRIFKDLDLVEQLGSGIPRILDAYPQESFEFTENFLRLVLPATEQVTEQVDPTSTPQVPHKLSPITDLVSDPVNDLVSDPVKNLLLVMDKEYSISELMAFLKLSHKPNFRKNYLQPAVESGIIELTIPEKPSSSKQKYRLTSKGKSIKKQ